MVKAQPKTVRDVIRRHLREEGKTIAAFLAPAWGMAVNSAYRRMYDSNALTPAHIDAVVEGLQLDEFDAAELYLLGAIEAGWKIRPQDVLAKADHVVLSRRGR